MKIFDFNIHLPYLQSVDVDDVIRQDMGMDTQSVIKGLEVHRESFSNVNGANLLLFNSFLFDDPASAFLKENLSSTFQSFFITNLIDFRRHDIEPYLQKAKIGGLRAVMFNSYLQKISDEDFPKVLQACKLAEKMGFIVCIDGSYGTSKMHTYDNMKLCCFIAENIANTPIVIVHSGGYNIIKAMLLALDKQNVWLDTSFSLPYYIGSSLETDFAFAYQKMDFKRVVFGSDHPYMPIANTIDIHLRFFERHNFPADAIENILFNNAAALFDA